VYRAGPRWCGLTSEDDWGRMRARRLK